MLLSAARSQLIAVDMQERLLPAILDADRVVHHAGILLQAADRLGVPVTITEQYPKGLGQTVPAVADRAGTDAKTLEKTAFSAAGEPSIADRFQALRAEGRDQAVLCGTEAHICVLQSALGLKRAGFEVFVVGDAVSSRSGHSVSAACARLLHAGCHWVTTEMVLFEWLERAGTDTFRALSALIK
jgi:nicotinamidase-related amidase